MVRALSLPRSSRKRRFSPRVGRRASDTCHYDLPKLRLLGTRSERSSPGGGITAEEEADDALGGPSAERLTAHGERAAARADGDELIDELEERRRRGAAVTCLRERERERERERAR